METTDSERKEKKIVVFNLDFFLDDRTQMF